MWWLVIGILATFGSGIFFGVWLEDRHTMREVSRRMRAIGEMNLVPMEFGYMNAFAEPDVCDECGEVHDNPVRVSTGNPPAAPEAGTGGYL